MKKVSKITLEDRWDLKCTLLAYCIVNGIPEDGEKLKQMNDVVFGKDCKLENVKKKEKRDKSSEDIRKNKTEYATVCESIQEAKQFCDLNLITRCKIIVLHKEEEARG